MKKRNKLALATPIAIGVATDSLGLWLGVRVAIVPAYKFTSPKTAYQ